MKKLLTILLALVLCVACLGLTACKDDVVGTYKFYSMTADGQTVVVGSAEANEYGITADYIIMVVKEDGTATITNNMLGGDEPYVVSGTWVKNNNSLTMTVQGESQTFTIDGDTLSLTEGGQTMVLKKA